MPRASDNIIPFNEQAVRKAATTKHEKQKIGRAHV